MISVVITTYNEVENLPGLKENLEGIDDVVLMDDSSTDGTQELARSYGWKVVDRKEIKKDVVTAKDVEDFTKQFGFAPTFKEGEEYRNMSVIRNIGASHAKYDWIYFPDADERVVWDLPKLKKLLDLTDVVYYTFIHARDEEGKPTCEFRHSKFYNKTKASWQQRIHEVVIPNDGARVTQLEKDVMMVNHFQKPSSHRKSYLASMEYAMSQDFKNSRMAYYLGREYVYNEMNEKAIKLLEYYVSLPDGWEMEKKQAMSLLGNCYEGIDDNKALDWYLKATKDCDRREPFYELGNFFYKRADYQKAVVWFKAALEIPFSNYYVTDSSLFSWRIHDLLAVSYSYLKNFEAAQLHWKEAFKVAPENQKERMVTNIKYIFK